MLNSSIKLILASFAVCSFLSCAHVPRTAPKFAAPVTTPLHKSVDTLKKNTDTAHKHLQNAITIVKTLPCKEEEARSMIVALNRDLSDAESELQTAQGTIVTLQTQLKQHDADLQKQTTLANQLSDNYNKLAAINAKNEIIVKKVNAYWGMGAIGYGFSMLFKRIIILIAICLAGILAVSIIFPAIIPVMKGVVFAVVQFLKRAFHK